MGKVYFVVASLARIALRRGMNAEPDEDFEIVPIPLDRETRLRLKEYAAAIGKPEVKTATILLF